MELQFVRGTSSEPKGHALVFFRGHNQGEILATYLVVLPIPIQLGKYLPPIFGARLAEFGANPPSIVPLPPVPETVASLAYLERLASARDDDLIDGGSINSADHQEAIQATSEIAQRYLTRYNDYEKTVGTLDTMMHEQAQPAPSLDTREVLYSLMGEHDRLLELSKLAGQLRYAVDGGDGRQMSETVAEMERLGKYLPAKYRITEFVQAAQVRGERGQRLAALHMDRCYKLFHEDYAALTAIEAELKSLLP